MQNHLDSSPTPRQSYSSMDPMGGGGQYPPHPHEFTTLTSPHNPHQQQHHPGHHHPGHEGYLVTTTSNGGGGPPPPPLNNSNSANNNNNNNEGVTNNNNSSSTANKPKKVPPPNGKKTKGRVKIKMEFIDNKLRRYTTFSKRKTGIMKKAYELSTLTGTQVMLLVASETGHVYTFATRKLQPMITSEAGKALIQTCLNSPDPPGSGADPQRMSATGYEETELTYAADPNASDHGGDTKDGESESGSEDGMDEDAIMMESSQGTTPPPPPLIPLSNGLGIPANLAALFASAQAAGLTPKQSFPLDLASHHHHNNHSSSSQQAASSSSSRPTLSQQEMSLLQHQLHQQIQLELLNEQQKLLKQHQQQQNNSSSSNNNNSQVTPNSNKVRIKREVTK